MCRRARCEVCKKTTFTGCGRHVEEILGGLDETLRCRCGATGGVAAIAPSLGARASSTVPAMSLA